ncbi:BID domain-containing T4SS effector [Bartonella taylorii]|uniref:BID domain-containing T4SS effector n=1 Tax=Bartonella taylorii TaxID=33046 RepID=UPI001ABBAC21|nr:BID domain-containing T4SS effector [Bartonella taylorii]
MPKAKVKTKGIPSPHHYFYPGTDTLKNKYGIKDPTVLMEVYARNVEEGRAQLREEQLPDYFDASYLCYIHKRLFSRTFEWAGQLRHVPFTFKDGTVAVMPEMISSEWGSIFATGDKIHKDLQTLDQILLEKNNLQGLSRKEFLDDASVLFASLHHTCPFRLGNEHAQEIFFENLAEAAGHSLDFSLVTQDSLKLASIKAEEEEDLEPLRNLFELISNPQRVSKKRMSPTKTQQKGHVSPEQPKTLKDEEKTAFTVRTTKELENVLIPGKKLVPLEKNKLFEMIAEDACVHTCREQIEILSKLVYGNPKILNQKMVEFITNPSSAQETAIQIKLLPESFAKLAGINFCGLKNAKRKEAEESSDMLAHAIVNFSHAVKNAEEEITQDYRNEQMRREKAVGMPSEDLQNLLNSSKEMQKTILRNSPTLQKELYDFVKNTNNRLSSNEQKVIQNGDYKMLAKIMDITENKAEQVTNIVQKAKEAYQQSQMHTMNRSKVLAIAS